MRTETVFHKIQSIVVRPDLSREQHKIERAATLTQGACLLAGITCISRSLLGLSKFFLLCPSSLPLIGLSIGLGLASRDIYLMTGKMCSLTNGEIPLNQKTQKVASAAILAKYLTETGLFQTWTAPLVEKVLLMPTTQFQIMQNLPIEDLLQNPR